MSEQSRVYDDFITALLDGKKPTVADFARSAIGPLERVETPIRYPTSHKAWPPEVWAEMERIRNGDHDEP